MTIVATPDTRKTFILGLDMGGTHTDAVLLEQGRLAASVKVPTNHADLLDSTRAALIRLFAENTAIAHPGDIRRVTFGTTLAVNAVVQGLCDPVGLVISAGPGMNPDWFGLGEEVFHLKGGLDHRGTEIDAPDEQSLAVLRKTILAWREKGIRAFACVSKFSTRNPVHENLMAETIRAAFQPFGETPILSLGHRLSGSLNFPRRITTAYWNAAVWSIHNQFANAVETSLDEFGIAAPVCLLKADGGSIPLQASRSRPVEALLSGPAASVMGMLALSDSGTTSADSARSIDRLVMDIGGTTTDIAILTDGQPVLAPRDLIIEGRSTLVRSLKSISIGLGGDSVIQIVSGSVTVGPERHGPACAFGGKDATFLDCLNSLGYATAGDIAASRKVVAEIAAQCDLLPRELAEEAVAVACRKVRDATDSLLAEVNSQPVYTLAALLQERPIKPEAVTLVGGPAQAMAPLLAESLGIPVETLGEPQGSVANAIGAGLTRPTAELELFADTVAGVLHVPSLGIHHEIDRRYTLDNAREEAVKLLSDSIAADFIDQMPPVESVEASLFATLDAYGRGGKDIRVRCQVRPGVVLE